MSRTTKKTPDAVGPPAKSKKKGKADAGEEGGDESGLEIDWQKHPEMTSTLITAIEDDEPTLTAMYPPPGQNARTNGLPKKHYHNELAVAVFGDHEKYKAEFEKACQAGGKDAWGNKIKNRLTALNKKTRSYIEEMGQTGAGLETEEDITPGTALATKWDLIKRDFPWFFRLRKLIGERPSQTPTGIGNTETPIDTSILLPTSDKDERDGSPTQWDLLSQSDGDGPAGPLTASSDAGGIVELSSDHEGDGAGDGDGKPKSEGKEDGAVDVDEAEKEKKRKRAASESGLPPPKKTKPKASVSTPAPTAVKTEEGSGGKGTGAKRGKAGERFQAAALEEEKTAQLALSVRKEKLQSQRDVEVERVRSETQYKVERMKIKAAAKEAEREGKLKMMQMKMDQEFRMAQLNQQQNNPNTSDYSFSYNFNGQQ